MTLLERTALAAVGILFAGASLAYVLIILQQILNNREGDE